MSPRARRTNWPRSAQIAIRLVNPQALDAAGLDPEVVRREKDVMADKYRQQGKPDAMIEKIVNRA